MVVLKETAHGLTWTHSLWAPTLGWHLRESPEQGEQYKPGWWRLRYSAHLPALSGDCLRKATVASLSTLYWEKAAPLMPDNSVPLHISLVPFKLPPQGWSSEQVSPCKSVCSLFKNYHLGLQKPSVSLSHNPCWILQPVIMETSLPGPRSLGWEA